jgi:hypothetical protein
MKTPEEMAEEYAKIVWDDSDLPLEDRAVERHVVIGTIGAKMGFLAGYKAAQAIVEEELQAVQAQRAESPGLGAAEYALKSVLAKMGQV